VEGILERIFLCVFVLRITQVVLPEEPLSLFGQDPKTHNTFLRVLSRREAECRTSGHGNSCSQLRLTVRIAVFMDLAIVLNYKWLEDVTFQKRNVFPSSGEGKVTPTL
jgi:hypothetical protein